MAVPCLLPDFVYLLDATTFLTKLGCCTLLSGALVKTSLRQTALPEAMVDSPDIGSIGQAQYLVQQATAAPA